jgi:peptide/nickel transport system permease protein
VLGVGLLGALALLTAVGPCLTAWRWNQCDLTAFGRPPSGRHWLGTTPTGRDMYAVTLRGLRASLLTGVLVAVAATGLAGFAGAVAGYVGGWTDRALTSVAELLLVLPPLLVAATAASALRGADLPVLAPLLAAFLWMVTARVVRGETRTLRDQEYVVAARHLGLGPLRVVTRHVLPNLAALLIVDATLNVSTAVVAETSLSYLGLGARPPDVSLGTVIADGAPSATTFPWLFLPPVTVLVVLILAVNLLGEGLHEAWRGTP